MFSEQIKIQPKCNFRKHFYLEHIHTHTEKERKREREKEREREREREREKDRERKKNNKINRHRYAYRRRERHRHNLATELDTKSLYVIKIVFLMINSIRNRVKLDYNEQLRTSPFCSL